jgi:hypothetical protein
MTDGSDKTVNTVLEFAISAAIGAVSGAAGFAVGVMGVIFQIGDIEVQAHLKEIHKENNDKNILLIDGYFASKGLSTPQQNITFMKEFVQKHGGTAWQTRFPKVGTHMLWHYKNDFTPKRGIDIQRGSAHGNAWATLRSNSNSSKVA